MGPLEGVKIVELAGIGPAPFCAMLLSDMGAEVIRVDRAANVGRDIGREGEDPRFALLQRGRRNIAVDLKNPDAVAAVLRLIERADALIEGFRPGVMERLGLAPDTCLARNPKLVYGRMTGWGQDGPIAHTAGHDINYIALSGRAVFDRPGGRPAGAAAEPDRRFRRRRAVSRDGGAGRHHQRPRDRQGSGHRLLDGRRIGLADDDDVRRAGGRRLGREARQQPHRRRRALLPRLRDEGRRACRDRLDRAAILCAAAEAYRAGGREPAGADRPQHLARHASAARSASSRQKTREEWTEIMEQTDICFAPVLRMSEAMRAPAQRPSRQLCRGGRHRAAGSGAALSRHAEPGAAPAGAGRRAHRRDPRGLGLFGRRDCGAA